MSLSIFLTAVGTALLLPSPASAHQAAGGMLRWNVDPLVLSLLALTAWLYGRGASLRFGFTPGEILAFWAGLATLVAALVSPLDGLAETLFAAHMVQHTLLMIVAAPLLVLGRPVLALLWAIPLQARKRAGAAGRRPALRRPWRWLAAPVFAWAVQAVVLWAWHVPQLFQAALSHDGLHALQHLSLLGSACLFWWSILDARHRGVGVLAVFTTAVHTGVLGALITFAPSSWYPAYQGGWGLTAVEDQQLAGIIMWLPGGVGYILAGLALAASALQRAERTGAVRERGGLCVVLVAVALLTGCGPESPPGMDSPTGDPARGRTLMQSYGCSSCHAIPGVSATHAAVGPPLTDMGKRAYIAGILPNTPADMVRWIREPQAIDARTVMPDMGVSEADARDMAAYLWSLQ